MSQVSISRHGRFRTKHQFVLDALRGAIVSGELQPGERLLASDLARDFEVSSMPVREALRQLEAEGLVTIRPHLGATVTRLSNSAPAELVEIRSVLEGLASRLAADRAQPDDFDELRRLLGRMDQALDGSATTSAKFADANLAFHGVILQASGSAELQRILNALHERTMRFRAQFLLVPGLAQHSQEDHRKLLAALEAGDGPGAEAIAREHHLRAYRELLAFEAGTADVEPPGGRAADHAADLERPGQPLGSTG